MTKTLLGLSKYSIEFPRFKRGLFVQLNINLRFFKHSPPGHFGFKQNLSKDVKQNLQDASSLVTWILESGLGALQLQAHIQKRPAKEP